MLPVILLIVLFFALQLLVLFCCVAAGNDPYSQFLSDEEQVEYLINWLNDRKDWLDQYFARRSIVLETIAAATAQPVVQTARKGY